MRMIDFHCNSCGFDGEQLIRSGEDPHTQNCRTCGSRLTVQLRPQRHYKPFHPYFDEGLGVFVTGRDHRRRVMRDLSADFRDHPSKGDTSARKDWAAQTKREQARRRRI